ncbi:phosphate transport regulator [Boudabousia marimammalium]|uniref:Phosphate transport regulator n=2 Tax=Boudabousia marimammalium TaxID=156892 RepID=A0A1Q5PML2_9ACTO|nr:phosphate transport regulator [Boudabousia marimammalium]
MFTQSAMHLLDGIKLLNQLVGAPVEERPALRDQLHSVEQSADQTRHLLNNKLNASFVTPLDREDISSLSRALDDCMDYMDEAGDLITLYKIQTVPAIVLSQIELLQRCCELTAEGMPALRKPESLRDYWVEINRLENEGDKLYRKALADIFDSGMDPLEVIKLKDIVETLEKAMDKFEYLANTVEAVSFKES